MARTNPTTGKPWTAAEDKAADRRAGIKEGSKRDEAVDRARGVPEEPPIKNNSLKVGKGQGVANFKGRQAKPFGGAKKVGRGQGMAPPPPMGPPPPAPLPMPPGVRPPIRRRRRPMPGPPIAPLGARRPPVLGLGGGDTGKSVRKGQRDPQGNYRAGVNAKGKKIGVGKGAGGRAC